MTPPEATTASVDSPAGSPADPAPVAGGDTVRAGPHRGAYRRYSKYFAIFRVSLAERMTYRGDFLLGTIFRFLPMVTTILLWQAIYQSSGRMQSDLAGYRYNEMIAYLLLPHISRMFSSMPGLAG